VDVGTVGIANDHSEGADGDPVAREAIDRDRAEIAAGQAAERKAEPCDPGEQIDQMSWLAAEKRHHDDAMACLTGPQRAAAEREERIVVAAHCAQTGNTLPLTIWYAKGPAEVPAVEIEHASRAPKLVPRRRSLSRLT
jgi:hypothetical protein